MQKMGGWKDPFSRTNDTTYGVLKMAITIEWLGHASFKISTGLNIYIDPWKLSSAPHDADILVLTHDHFDHYEPEDIAKVINDKTQIIASADVAAKEPAAKPMRPGDSLEIAGITFNATAAYNTDKEFHPKANDWLGFIFELESKRIYFAGDTDETPEMLAVENIDLAMLPVGGTYTLTGDEAAAAVNKFAPRQALPYHWGDIVGTQSDADTFAEKSNCTVTILQPGQSITL